MGYNLTIGEAVIEYWNEDDYYHTKEDEYEFSSSCYITAEMVYHENAPSFGNPTDGENTLWPSYTAWVTSMEIAGIFDLSFYENRSMRGGHPGAFPITDIFVERVRKAKNELISKGAIAQYDSTNEDAALIRVEWLLYWSEWALKNCKNPVLANS